MLTDAQHAQSVHPGADVAFIFQGFFEGKPIATCQECQITCIQEPDFSGVSAQGETFKHASREEQHARYIDCGPQAWDDRD